MAEDDFSQRLGRIFFPEIQVFSGNIENLSKEYQSDDNKYSISVNKTFLLNNIPIVYNFSAQMELQNDDYVNAVCIRDWFGGKFNVVALHNASTNACYYKQTFMLSMLMLFCLPIFFFIGALFLLSPFTAPITLLFWGAIPVGIWGLLNALRAKNIVLEFQRENLVP